MASPNAPRPSGGTALALDFSDLETTRVGDSAAVAARDSVVSAMELKESLEATRVGSSPVPSSLEATRLASSPFASPFAQRPTSPSSPFHAAQVELSARPSLPSMPESLAETRMGESPFHEKSYRENPEITRCLTTDPALLEAIRALSESERNIEIPSAPLTARDLEALIAEGERMSVRTQQIDLDPSVLDAIRDVSRDENLDGTRVPTTPRTSHLRLRSRPMAAIAPPIWPAGSSSNAVAFLTLLGQRHQALTSGITSVQQRIATLKQKSADREMVAMFAEHVGDLALLRTALAKVYFCVADIRASRLVGHTTTLGTYLVGLYIGAAHVVRALEAVATSIEADQADWRAFLASASAASSYQFSCLVPQIRAEASSLSQEAMDPADPLAGLADKLEELFVCAPCLRLG